MEPEANEQSHVEAVPADAPPLRPVPTVPDYDSPFTCARCSGSLKGLAIDALCPGCGIPVAVAMSGGVRGGGPSGLSIASMVCGIVSLLLGFMYGVGIVPATCAIVFAMVSFRRAGDGSSGVGTRGLAVTGFWTGIVGMLISLAMVAFMVWIFSSF